jgi:anti-anti-sigma regulatory factor
VSSVAPLRITANAAPNSCVLTVEGILDGSTYRTLRDTVVKSALDQPSGVVVNVTRLDAPSPSAWAVFTSARWHVSTWPDVPITLVCEHERGRLVLHRNGITRYVPAYADLASAVAALDRPRGSVRRRARTTIARPLGRAEARRFVADSLHAWDSDGMSPAAATVAWLLVDNVLEHTLSDPVLIVEEIGGVITIAVEDASSSPAVRRESAGGGTDVVSGLAIVNSLTRIWGSAPTSTGKTVWAVLGPENRL